MSYDNEGQEWRASRRDAQTGLLSGDVSTLETTTAYFVRTHTTEYLQVFRARYDHRGAMPLPVQHVYVGEGWNLIPVLSNAHTPPHDVLANEYLRTLGDDGWVAALTFKTESTMWETLHPRTGASHTIGRGYWLFTPKGGAIVP